MSVISRLSTSWGCFNQQLCYGRTLCRQLFPNDDALQRCEKLHFSSRNCQHVFMLSRFPAVLDQRIPHGSSYQPANAECWSPAAQLLPTEISKKGKAAEKTAGRTQLSIPSPSGAQGPENGYIMGMKTVRNVRKVTRNL
jgi:hypothetical protein